MKAFTLTLTLTLYPNPNPFPFDIHASTRTTVHVIQYVGHSFHVGSFRCLKAFFDLCLVM